MVIFHLSDLHIGLKLFNRDLKEDQAYIFRRIIKAAEKEQPDAVVIAGDVYDKAVPSAEAVELFDRFISELTAAVPNAEIMIISGNHDSAARLNCFRNILKNQKVHMIGLPPVLPEERIEKVTLEDAYGKVNFYLLPFVRPSMVKAITGTDENGNNLSYDQALRKLLAREAVDETERNVLVSHQFYLPKGIKAEQVERMDTEIRTVGDIDEVSTEVLKPFDYAALGHIHKPMKAGNECYRYPGTPLAASVSEAGQKKGILKVGLEEKGTVNVTVLPLEPLREVKVVKGTLEEVLKEGSADYVTVLLTDKADLDVIDMQDRLRNAFPNLLEIRRETLKKGIYDKKITAGEIPGAFELCTSFLGDADEKELALLKDVLNTVMEKEQ